MPPKRKVLPSVAVRESAREGERGGRGLAQAAGPLGRCNPSSRKQIPTTKVGFSDVIGSASILRPPNLGESPAMDPTYLEELVEKLCSSYTTALPDVPEHLQDDTFQLLMIDPIEGICCKERDLRCGVMQERVWNSQSSQLGICQLCRREFVPGMSANGNFRRQKSVYLFRWATAVFESVLPSLPSPNEAAVMVSLIYKLASNHASGTSAAQARFANDFNSDFVVDVGKDISHLCWKHVSQMPAQFVSLSANLAKELCEQLSLADSVAALPAITALIQKVPRAYRFLLRLARSLNQLLFLQSPRLA